MDSTCTSRIRIKAGLICGSWRAWRARAGRAPLSAEPGDGARQRRAQHAALIYLLKGNSAAPG